MNNRLFFQDTEIVDWEVQELETCYQLEMPSVSLSTILRKQKLDEETKLLLAYLISKAVWQFYNSEWMNECWTSYGMMAAASRCSRRAQTAGQDPARSLVSTKHEQRRGNEGNALAVVDAMAVTTTAPRQYPIN